MSRRLIEIAEAVVAVALPILASAFLVVRRQGLPLPAGTPALLPRIALGLGIVMVGLIERRIFAVSRSKEAGSGHGV